MNVLKPGGTILLLSLIASIAGCTSPAPPAPTGARGIPKRLGFLQYGVTSMTEVVLYLGKPSGRFENGRILTYRIWNYDTRGNYHIVERKGRSSGWPQWHDVHYSLVLVFDSRETLTEHALVKVK